MSYHTGNNDLRNRQNILQDLQQQKQQLLQHGSVSNTATLSTNNLMNRFIKHDIPQYQGVTLNRRNALEYANSHSSGHFMASDSTLGNPILPVIPRVDDS